MGDTRRFSMFADFIADRFASTMKVADVAGGKGRLQSKLRLRGFGEIVSWDTRPKYAGPRRIYHYGRFDYRSAPRDYDIVVGMHPDEATDHIILYAAKHRVPFVVCPCCVKPTASAYQGYRYQHWLDHLTGLAERAGMKVEASVLPMHGRNVVLTGTPAVTA